MHRFFMVAACAVLASCQKSDKNIVLVVPVEHAAMADIQDGFIATLKASHPDCHVDVKNAMGDPNLMQSILRTANTQNVAYVATIGVGLTTAAKKLCPQQTIIGLAAYKELADDHTYVVEDEIGPDTLDASVKAMFPDVKKVTLIHAQDDKIIKEAKDIEKLMRARGVEVQMLPVLHANDLQTVCQHIQGEVVLVLKDHTVVSGLSVILKHARAHNIAFVASDEGSVKNGATYAFGVSEHDTGVKGAAIISKLISEQKPDKVVKLDPMYIINKETPQELVQKMREQKSIPVHTVELLSHAHA